MKLLKPKTCSCGALHERIPDTARQLNEKDLLDGFYWECPCGSTLWAKPDEIDTAVFPDMMDEIK